MMTNLFSIFDPSTNLLNFNMSLNWMSLMIVLLMIPTNYWMIFNNLYLIFNNMMNLLFNELKMIINKKNNNFNMIFISLFIYISLNNLIGLFPYIFTVTSHLVINMTMALPLWMALILYGWMNKIKHMFIHLVPQGTPNMLIPFMVMIETISNIIRPVTLTIRLTANMIAGHLLLTLLGNLGHILSMMMISTLILMQIILMSLELAVSIIQAYVFTILLTLYTSEI